MQIPQTVIDQIYMHAEGNKNQEVCGYADLEQGIVYPCENIDSDPVNHFMIDPDAHVSLTETFNNLCIYHTHHGENAIGQLSDHDVISSKATKSPMLMVDTHYGYIDYFDPASINPYPLRDNPYTPGDVEFYLGWEWRFERSDCYALFRNYYRGRLGIELNDYPRGASPADVTLPTWNLFTDNYEREGFRKLDHDEPLRDHDVILMCLIGNQVHHCAIVVDAAKRHCIHVTCAQSNDGELIPKLSEKFAYGHHGYWVDHTRLVIRHKSLDI